MKNEMPENRKKHLRSVFYSGTLMARWLRSVDIEGGWLQPKMSL